MLTAYLTNLNSGMKITNLMSFHATPSKPKHLNICGINLTLQVYFLLLLNEGKNEKDICTNKRDT